LILNPLKLESQAFFDVKIHVLQVARVDYNFYASISLVEGHTTFAIQPRKYVGAQLQLSGG